MSDKETAASAGTVSNSELIEPLGVMVPLNDNTDRENWLNSWVRCSCGCRRKVKNCKRYIETESWGCSCGCRRKVKNCKRDTETESWEMPWIKYEVCVCPRCGNSMEENPFRVSSAGFDGPRR